MSTGKCGNPGNAACHPRAFSPSFAMTLPSQPVTLTVEQLADLRTKLSTMRHDIANQLALIVAASELIRLKPQTAERMLVTLGEQPTRISLTVDKFTEEFDRSVGITRP